METKQSIRKQALAKREGLTAEYRSLASETICRNLCTGDTFVQADMILIYAAYRSEVNTDSIIKQALQQGKRVYCPKVFSDIQNASQVPLMEFYEIENLDEVLPGYRGIPEPEQNPLKQFSVEALQTQYKNQKKEIHILLIMPGAAFDRGGNRIGYGKGFYDTYIEKCDRDLHSQIAATIHAEDNLQMTMKLTALAFACQLWDNIPADIYDKRVDTIITEQEQIECYQEES